MVIYFLLVDGSGYLHHSLAIGGGNNIVTGAWVWLATFGAEPAREVGVWNRALGTVFLNARPVFCV